MKKYDFILIGTGQATGTILPELLGKKLKIAVVESDKTGGTCVNWGCTPTWLAELRNLALISKTFQ